MGCGRGLTLSRTFCNQRWENYLHKSTITLPAAPGGRAQQELTHLCSVLQMGGGAVQAAAAGVHGGIPAAGSKTPTHKNQIHAVILLFSQNNLLHADTEYISSSEGKHVHACICKVTTTTHKHVVCCTRSRYKQEDVGLSLQTHQRESAACDTDMNIRYQQHAAIMAVLRAGGRKWMQR